MARTGDPCTTCGRKEPHVSFTKVRGKNEGTRRERPVWYRPSRCDSCRRKSGRYKGNLTVAATWAKNARKQGLAGKARCDFTVGDWWRALRFFNHRCAYCGASRSLTRDHVRPLTRGGAHTASNIVPACRLCNEAKDNKPLEAFAAPATVEHIRAFFASLDAATSRSGKAS